MELRGCAHLNFIQAIKGGLVTKVANVAHGQPKLKFKKLTDIYDCFMPHSDDRMVERSCFDAFEESTVKTMPDASVRNVNDGDDQRIINLDDDDFDNFTLTQIKESCKSRKRKHSQDLDSPERIIKIEDLSFQEDYIKEEMEADDSDFLETLSSLKSKLSKNLKVKKKRCTKDPISTYTQEIMLVVKTEEILYSQEFPPYREEIQNDPQFPPSSEKIQEGQEFSPNDTQFPPSSEKIQEGQELLPSSEEIQDSQEFPAYNEEIENDEEIPSSSGDSGALVEVKSEVPDTDFFEPNDYSIIESQEAEIVYEWNLENELSNEWWQKRVDFIPLQMVRPSGVDIVISNSQLSNDQSPYMPAIEFESEECTPDLHYISPQVMSLVEDHNAGIYDNQPNGDSDTTVSLPNVAPHKDHDFMDVEFKDNTFLGDCSNEEFTTGSEGQVKLSSTIEEHGPNLDGCLIRPSDDPPEYEEKQSFASVNIDEKRHVDEATDELTSWDECNGSSKLHRPERLLSTRKTISPSSQERLCKAIQSVDLNHKNNLKCKGKLNFSQQADKMNGTTEEGLDDVTGAQFTDIPNKITVIPRTSKRVSPRKSISKIPHSSRQASRPGCNTVQSCSKSAIAFTQQQMHDVECLAMKLTKELKSMKDIVDDMLRSEFCLNTPLRHKVNEARMAVKNATRAEESTKRCLAFMSRDCSRFCKIMKLADTPAPKEVVRKEKKKIAFADEAGGKLCHVMIYEDDGARKAVKNATRAEESTKRCLAFMSRDCSRFCKIMKLADTPAPKEVVRKEKKKIAFADEAGGKLCHVMIYEDDGVSMSESN